jgi:hypothetical protein
VCFSEKSEKAKKEEFPGPMDDMLPGNSFPQICVVSVNKSVGNGSFRSGQYCSLFKITEGLEPKVTIVFTY